MMSDESNNNAILASPMLAGIFSIAIFVLWILAVVDMAVVQSRAFPNLSDQFIPAMIRANVLAATLGWLPQIALGTVFFLLSFQLSYYLADRLNMTMVIALVAGIVAGVFLVAAGTGGQENIFVSVFYTPEQASELARAMGTQDLTAITASNSWVSGGLRSTAAYAQGWAMILWCLFALKTKQFPRVLNWIGIIAAVLFGLTVWVGPFTGPIAFIALLVWHLWLGIVLLRSPQPAKLKAAYAT